MRKGQKIKTQWILTVDPLKTEDEWSSSLLGHDEFTKVLDIPEERYLSAPTSELSALLANAKE